MAMQHIRNDNRKMAGIFFSQRLKELLEERYGSVPSAEKFSDAFNLRAHGTTTISRETARKWLKGDAIPELSRLKVLMTWLGIDPSVLFETALRDPLPEKTAKPKVDYGVSDRPHVKLLGLLNELDEKSIEALFLTAWALREVEKSRAKDGGYRAMPRLPEK
jgi:transcriptional regulator with XRE-family HTH domain